MVFFIVNYQFCAIYQSAIPPRQWWLLCNQLKYYWKGNPNNTNFYLYFHFFIGSLKALQPAVQGLTWHDSTSTSTSDLTEVRSTHPLPHT